MRFISPKTDFAFKKIFGSNQSKNILISFLNAIVYSEKNVIQDLEIIDPYNPPSTPILKDSYLDVKALLDNGTTIIIEMQVINVPAFEKRIIYNLTKTYANQLKYGQGYRHLQPVIALTITDFNLFTEIDDIITFWVFKEQNKSINYKDEELKMIFVELPKFNKNLEELETITDKWIYFIKEAPSLEMIPDKMEKITAINEALKIANQANLTEKELDELHHQEVFLEDQSGYVIKGRQEGLKQGLEIGKQEGLEIGKQEGLQEGLILGKIELIQRQIERKLGKITDNVKTFLQSLSLEELDDLSIAMFDFHTLDDLENFILNLKGKQQ